MFLISSQLRPENRTFALAYQLALVEFAALLDRMVAEAAAPDEGVRQLLHMSLANYAAGAIMMPYGRFLKACEEMRYSIDRLCGEFGANVEQVAHRLTTLSRPGARGVPFFMLRVDPAGNISKRYAGDQFPFSRFGGTCPRWNLHAAFQAAGQVVTQLIETPDGQTILHRRPDHRAADQVGPVGRTAGGRARLRHCPRAQIALRRGL